MKLVFRPKNYNSKMKKLPSQNQINIRTLENRQSRNMFELGFDEKYNSFDKYKSTFEQR